MVGQAVPRGVRIGQVEIPAGPTDPSSEPGRRVQVLFRPEDVAVKTTRDALRWPSLGAGIVESRAFLGGLERLRLRLPLRGVRTLAPAAPFGEDSVVVEAVRSQHQARRFPLSPGATAWVGVRRIHTLAHPGIGLLAVDDGSPAGANAVAIAKALASSARARAVIVSCAASEVGGSLPEGPAESVRREAERVLPDLVVAGATPKSALRTATELLAHGEYSLLLVPEGASVPSKFLVCTAAGEPAKGGIRFAGRLARHLGAELGVLSVLPREDAAARAQVERHLAACARTVAPLGIAARTCVRVGEIESSIRAEAEAGGFDLIVVGSPWGAGASTSNGPVAGLVSDLSRPILVVRHGTEAL